MKTEQEPPYGQTLMTYMDGLILTQDDARLNETIKSIYYSMILEGFEHEDTEYYIVQKVLEKLGQLK